MSISMEWILHFFFSTSLYLVRSFVRCLRFNNYSVIIDFFSPAQTKKKKNTKENYIHKFCKWIACCTNIVWLPQFIQWWNWSNFSIFATHNRFTSWKVYKSQFLCTNRISYRFFFPLLVLPLGLDQHVDPFITNT